MSQVLARRNAYVDRSFDLYAEHVLNIVRRARRVAVAPLLEDRIAVGYSPREHPTMRGMLRLMQRVIRPPDSVADLGAGSAVLSIAAAKLGATRIAAIEIDDGAEGSALENIRANGVEDAVRYLVGDATVLLALVAPVRVVLANIVSSVLMELLPGMTAALAPEGAAMLSGILVEERDLMLRAITRSGLSMQAEDIEGDWLSILVNRAS